MLHRAAALGGGGSRSSGICCCAPALVVQKQRFMQQVDRVGCRLMNAVTPRYQSPRVGSRHASISGATFESHKRTNCMKKLGTMPASTAPVSPQLLLDGADLGL